MSKILNKSDILDFDDLPTKEIPVSEWGKDSCVKIRVISGLQRQEWYEALRVLRAECKEDEEAFIVRFQELKNLMLSMAIVDEGNRPVFSKEEAAGLSKKNPSVTDRLFTDVRNFCGMSQESQGNLEKN